MKYILLLATFLFIGCVAPTRTITVPLDGKLINENEATVIIYQSTPTFAHEASGRYLILMDGMEVGYVSSELPLKISVAPGSRAINTKTMFSDAVTNIVFEAGQVYYMRLWISHGLLFSTSRIDQTAERARYETITYHP